jgi:phosphonate transport system permease protein
MIFLGKMLAEDIENVRAGPIEAMRATGAGFGPGRRLRGHPAGDFAATGVAIYRLDANVRHSTVIGIVGRAASGRRCRPSFSRYEHDFAAAILLSIIALVALGEWFSDWVRRRMR